MRGAKERVGGELMKDDDPIYKAVEKGFDDEYALLCEKQRTIEAIKNALISKREDTLRILRGSK